jgi:hypothetical protein
MDPMQNPIWPTDPARLSAPPRVRRSQLPGLPSPAEFVSPQIMWALLQATVVIGMLVLISGAGSPAMPLNGRGDPATAHAVEVLIGGGESNDVARRAELIAAVPADYRSVMGYRPEIIDINGTLSLGKPIGACSSPVHLTFDMEPTCKGHDFGYDLLRYAAEIGIPLGEWARPLIDEWWYAEMHSRCDLTHSGPIGLACHGQVLATEAIIDANSWREGNGPPIEENPWRYLGALLMLPATVSITMRLRRWDLPHRVGQLQNAPASSGLSS